MNDSRPRITAKQILLGLGYEILVLLITGMISAFVGSFFSDGDGFTGLFFMFQIGISQVLILPFFVLYLLTNDKKTELKVMLIAAGILFLINGLCDSVFLMEIQGH